MESKNTKNKPTSWLWGARTVTMPKWIARNPKAFRLLYEFSERSHREEEDVEYEGVLIHLKPREFITGRPSTSEKVGITEQEYRTLFKKFEKSTLITTIRVTSKFTVGKYLADGIFFNNPVGQEPTEKPIDQPTSNQHLTTINKEKEEKNNKEQLKKIEEIKTITRKKMGWSKKKEGDNG